MEAKIDLRGIHYQAVANACGLKVAKHTRSFRLT
jgi:hypothetical protein